MALVTQDSQDQGRVTLDQGGPSSPRWLALLQAPSCVRPGQGELPRCCLYHRIRREGGFAPTPGLRTPQGSLLFVLKKEGSGEGIGSVRVSLSADKKGRASARMCQGAVFR